MFDPLRMRRVTLSLSKRGLPSATTYGNASRDGDSSDGLGNTPELLLVGSVISSNEVASGSQKASSSISWRTSAFVSWVRPPELETAPCTGVLVFARCCCAAVNKRWTVSHVVAESLKCSLDRETSKSTVECSPPSRAKVARTSRAVKSSHGRPFETSALISLVTASLSCTDAVVRPDAASSRSSETASAYKSACASSPGT